jgi:hypothetical protein
MPVAQLQQVLHKGLQSWLVERNKEKLVILPDSASREGCGEKDHSISVSQAQEVNQTRPMHSKVGEVTVMCKYCCTRANPVNWTLKWRRLSTTLLLIPVRGMHSSEESGKTAIQSDAPTNWLQRDVHRVQAGSQQSSLVQIDQTEAGHGRPYSLCSVLTPWKASVCLIKKFRQRSREALVLI